MVLMPPFGPISRQEFIRALQRAGYQGPIIRGRFIFMRNGHLRTRVPEPSMQIIDVFLLEELLGEAGIDRTAWERL